MAIQFIAGCLDAKEQFPWAALLFASGIVIGNDGYAMGGGYKNWKYDATNDRWTQLAFFTERTGGSAFAIGNYAYYGLGSGLLRGELITPIFANLASSINSRSYGYFK